MIGHVLRASVHLDAGYDSRIRENFNKWSLGSNLRAGPSHIVVYFSHACIRHRLVAGQSHGEGHPTEGPVFYRVWTNWARERRDGFELRKEKKTLENKPSAEKTVREMRRKTGRRFSEWFENRARRPRVDARSGRRNPRSLRGDSLFSASGKSSRRARNRAGN